VINQLGQFFQRLSAVKLARRLRRGAPRDLAGCRPASIRAMVQSASKQQVLPVASALYEPVVDVSAWRASVRSTPGELREAS